MRKPGPGRPRKPIEAKILEGTFRRDEDGDPTTLVLAQGEPAAPGHLKGEALAFWRQVVPGLVKLGVAKEPDGPTLALLCEWWARYRKHSRALDRMRGNEKQLYQRTVLAGICWSNFDKIASRFGLTPSDRARLRLAGGDRPKPPDSVTGFARKRS